jgi:thiamine-phosphate pyrophosphorylase
MTDQELLRAALELRRMTLRYHALFIVNNRPDIAFLAAADGVHLGQDDLPVSEARKILRDEKIVGVSTHNLEQAQRAVRDGADYIGVGPVYPTRTKKDVVSPVTLDYVREAANADLPIPFFAIGGIKVHNASEVLAAGASRLAVVTAIVGSPDPAQAATDLRSIVDKRPLK